MDARDADPCGLHVQQVDHELERLPLHVTLHGTTVLIKVLALGYADGAGGGTGGGSGWCRREL